MKKILAVITTVAMVFTMFAAAPLHAEEQMQEEARYVEVKVEFDPDYAVEGYDTEGRIKAANEAISQIHASTLKEANNQLKALFTNQGNYTGEYPSCYNPNKMNKVENVGAFWFDNDTLNQMKQPALNRPLASVEYIVHGTIQSDGYLELGKFNHYQYAYAPLLKITGVDNAKIAGTVALDGYIAGGYEKLFVESGAFIVSNIEFTETEGFTNIGTAGQMGEIGNPNMTLTVENCVFHNKYHNVGYFPKAASQIKNFTNNKFIGSGSTDYAFFVQGEGTDISFTGNEISGYEGGIYIGFDAKPNVVIRDNTIRTNDATGGSIQLSNAGRVEISGNTISNESGAAIEFVNKMTPHGTGGLFKDTYRVDEAVIYGNTIDSKYLAQVGSSEELANEIAGLVATVDLSNNAVSDATNVYEWTYGNGTIRNPAYKTITICGENVVTENTFLYAANGENVIVHYAAADGYHLTGKVKINGKEAEANGMYEFKNVTEDMILEVATEAHTFEWVIDKEPTATEKGSKHEECTVCGHKKPSVEIPMVTPIDPENPDTEKPNNNVGTGDQTNIGLFVSLLSLSMVSIAVLAVWKKKKAIENK